MNAQFETQAAVRTSHPNGSLRIWDPVVRLFHWTVVFGCLANLLIADGGSLHRVIGYVIAAAIAIRLVWGFLATGHARFSTFIPHPAAVGRYLKLLLQGHEPRYLGHNPAGAVMMVALVGLLIATCITGWMLGLDRYWGNEALEEVHEICANAILPLAALHVLAAIIESVRHRENLIKSMITGRKRPPAGTDIDNAANVDRR